MSKEQISKHDLQRMALQNIRSYPGCEYVKDVQIEYKVDRVQKTNWIMHVFTREGATWRKSRSRSMPRDAALCIAMS